MERLEEAQGRARRARAPSSPTSTQRLGRARRRRATTRPPTSTRSWPRWPPSATRRPVDGLPEDLLALYDKLRAAKGGVGAAPRCDHARCGGCRLELDHAELGRHRGRAVRRGDALRGVPADPGPHRPSRVCDRFARSSIEADGGSRGNPGPAAYGARAQGRGDRGGARRGRRRRSAGDQQRRGVRRPDRRPRALPRARTRRRHRGADGLQARRRADVGPLEDQAPRHAAARASRPAGWRRSARPTPGSRASRTSTPTGWPTRRSTAGAAVLRPIRPPARARTDPRRPGRRDRSRDAGGSAGPTLVLVRHGVTPHTVEKRFSGGLAAPTPGSPTRAAPRSAPDRRLAGARPTARDVAVRTGRWSTRRPLRRTRESRGDSSPSGSGRRSTDGVAEMEFGVWDGLTSREVAASSTRRPRRVARLARRRAAAGGESFRRGRARVLAARDRLLAAYRGKTVVVVSHVTPIKTLVAHALGAPLESVFRMELRAGVGDGGHATSPEHGERADGARCALFNAPPT